MLAVQYPWIGAVKMLVAIEIVSLIGLVLRLQASTNFDG